MTCILRDLKIFSDANLAICGIFSIVCRQIGFRHTKISMITAKKEEPAFIATGSTFTSMNILVFVHFNAYSRQ